MPHRLTRTRRVALAAGAWLPLACTGRTPPPAAVAPAPLPGVVCPMVGIPSVVVELRDEAGRAAALGATVEVRGDGFRERRVVRSLLDTLRAGFASNRAGTFSVRVTRPGYAPAETSGVHVPAGDCFPARRAMVPFTLRLLADAPDVRDVVILTPGLSLGQGMTMEPGVWVSAAEGADTRVRWHSSNPRAVAVDSAGRITAGCVKPGSEATITATSVADPRRRGRVGVTVVDFPAGCGRPGR